MYVDIRVYYLKKFWILCQVITCDFFVIEISLPETSVSKEHLCHFYTRSYHRQKPKSIFLPIIDKNQKSIFYFVISPVRQEEWLSGVQRNLQLCDKKVSIINGY